MSEHAWVEENIASYTAGGLDAEERQRLEQHAGECGECAQRLREARSLDQSLSALFGNVRLGPGLEERLIRAVRMPRRRRRFATKIFLGVAATVLVGVVGWQGSLIVEGNHPFGRIMDPLRVVVSDDSKSMGYTRAAPVQDYQPASVEDMARQLGDQALAEEASTQAAETSLGYYPPASSLVVKGASGKKTMLGGRAESHRSFTLADHSYHGVTDQAPLGTTANASNPSSSPALGDKPDVSYKNSAPADYSSQPLNTMSVQPGFASGGQFSNRGGGIGGGGIGGGGGALVPGTASGKLGEQFRPFGFLNPATPGQGYGSSPPLPQYFRPADLQPPTAKSPISNAPSPESNIVTGKVTGGVDQTAIKQAMDALKASSKTQEQQLAQTKPSDKEKAGDRSANQPWLHLNQGGDPALNYFNGVVPQKVNNQKGNADKDSTVEALGKPTLAEPAPAPRKIIIRSGSVEFEIQSFDAAVAAITLLTNNIKGGFVDTVNSEKLPNGKVRGSVVVRVPPEHLDTLVLGLRKELGKMGELKNLRVGSEDITKRYTDLESRLRAARTMEERLLQIIKTGKGEIKDLLLAEKELGVWRTKIEEVEGELRYYSNLVSLSTLTIALYEKEIRAPFALVETERVQMGVEVEDVDKALQQATAAVTEAKGRVTKSELKQQAAGQFSAVLNFEVAPDSAGPLRDRLRQLGNVARLEIDRLQEAEGGTGKPQETRSKRHDTQFFVSLYNLANVAPRETVQINLASMDVEADYRTILAGVHKAAGRVVTSALNRQRNEQTSAAIQFEVKSAEAENVLRQLKQTGELLLLQTTENPDAANVTNAKRGFNLRLLGLGLVTPRETINITVATRDVPASYRALQEAVNKVKARALNATLNEQDKQNVTGDLEFEVRRADQPAIDTALAAVGETFSRTAARAPDADNVLDSLVRLHISLVNVGRIAPRENVVLGVEVNDVDNSAANFSALVHEGQGRTVESHVAHERSGRVTAKLIYDVPLASAAGLSEKFRSAGTVRVLESSRNTQVPEGPLATARFDVTLSNAELIVPSDDGLWPQIRKGLSTSFVALSWSLTVVIVGLCFVLPWALVAYGIYRMVLRGRRPSAPASPAA